MKQTIKTKDIVDEFEFIHETQRKTVQCTQNIKKYNLVWPDKIYKNTVQQSLEKVT